MSARSSLVVCTFVLFGLFLSSCSLGDTFAPQPTPTATRTRRPTSTPVPTETDTPTATSTPLNTATFTAVPPTATDTALPATITFTPRPPTATFTRRPPTLTFTPAPPPPPANTPVGGCPQPVCGAVLSSRNLTENECGSVGTLIKGIVKHPDGTPYRDVAKLGSMRGSIEGVGTGPYKYPGEPKDWPNNADGTYAFAIVNKWNSDFKLHLFISERTNDDSLSNELVLPLSAGINDNCGKPGTVNYYAVDWIIK